MLGRVCYHEMLCTRMYALSCNEMHILIFILLHSQGGYVTISRFSCVRVCVCVCVFCVLQTRVAYGAVHQLEERRE